MVPTVGNSCECGLTYVRGLDEDEKRHARFHSEYARGPKITQLKQLPTLGLVNKLTIHVVDRTVPEAIRKKVAHVAYVAARSMPGSPAGYDGTHIENDDVRLYLLAKGNHVVAIVITALDPFAWNLKWGRDGAVELIEKRQIPNPKPTICRVWVAADYRKKGLAVSLITEECKHLNVSPQMLGWVLPFTTGGQAVARKFSPDNFFGHCDPYTLQDVLNPK